MTVRRTAAEVGIHRDTAFRWRHRLLNGLRANECHLPDLSPPSPGPIEGRILVGETWFLRSEKGRRQLDQPPRRHRSMTDWLSAPRVWVLVARSEDQRTFHQVVGPRRPTADDLVEVMGAVLGRDAILVSPHGPAGSAALAARRLGVGYERRQSLLASGRIEDDVVRLKRWLRRFCGVATRYLPNYLVWHRALHANGALLHALAGGLP